jgi:hypothetical protein
MQTGGRELIGVLGLCGVPHLDYFLSDEVSVGAAGVLFRSFDSGESGFFFAAAYGHIEYHLSSSSRLCPYVGVQVGALTPDAEPLFGLGPQIGLKWFVTRSLSINGQLAGAVHAQSRSEGVIFAASLTIGLSFHL